MILMLFYLFLHVWWLLVNLLPESGFCWKKGCQDAILRKIKNSKKIYRWSYIDRRLTEPEGEPEGGHQGPTPAPGAGQGQAAPGHGVAALAHLWRCPSSYIIPLENLRLGERPETYSAAAAKRKTLEREKLSGREKSTGEIPSRRVGNRRHRHRHRAGLRRDHHHHHHHHHHHLHHQHHHHHHLHSVPM